MIVRLARIVAALRRLLVTIHARLVSPQRGQATVEYALVMIGVAAVAGLLIGWVRGTDLIEKLFDRVVKQITP